MSILMAVHLVIAWPLLAAPISGDGPRRSADEELVRMGREIPGFGGLFYDEQGRPNVWLLDTRGAGAAALKRLGPEVRVRRGEYEFERLLAWRRELRPLLALPGIVYLDADEARNRVVLGLDASSRGKSLDRERLERELLFTGVPRQAVLLEETAPVEELVSVQSKLRPAPGGIQILFPINPPSFGVCTLGFNAARGGVVGFVINSHCTGVRGEIDGMTYYQSLPQDGSIGTEIVDPPYFTEGPCPPGRQCRVSDSAFAKYSKARTGLLGRIARPTFGDAENGSLTLSPGTARFTIAGKGDSPLSGEILHKVGRTTGWTYGTVVSTCADVNITGTDYTQLCQARVRGGGGPGDSGSPVFYRVGASTKIKLAGILWGGTFDPLSGAIYVFSPLDNIEEELGPLKVN
jgi:hypothetical protein